MSIYLTTNNFSVNLQIIQYGKEKGQKKLNLIFVTSKINNYQQVKGEQDTQGTSYLILQLPKRRVQSGQSSAPGQKLQRKGKQPQIALGDFVLHVRTTFSTKMVVKTWSRLPRKWLNQHTQKAILTRRHEDVALKDTVQWWSWKC